MKQKKDIRRGTGISFFHNPGPAGRFFKGRPVIQSIASDKDEYITRESTGNSGIASTPLPGGLRSNMEMISGQSLADVRVNYDSREPDRVGALAYTQGTTIHIAPGQERHLAHEAWHTVQQKQGRVNPTTEIGGEPVNDEPALEKEADVMGEQAIRMKPVENEEHPAGTNGQSGRALQRKGNGCGCAACQGEDPLQMSAVNGAVMQFVRPSNLVNHNFIGRGVEVHPTMRARLRLVEDHLQAQYDALPADEQPATLREYAGLNTINGWRESTTFHGTGSAVDVNYTPQPYIATRTTEGGTTTYGGEQGGATAETRALRRPAVEVYDRAVDFMRMTPFDPDTADVGNRRVGESATSAYRRFKHVSDSLASYLGLVILTSHTEVTRAPVNDPENIPEADLLAAIPLTERKDETTAIADIQAQMDYIFWQIEHYNYPLTARELFIRILRDYEIVRRPMQYGNPAIRPARTRNPARGFLHMPEHFVVAMMDVGNLRWGACEFSARSNGDVHHFDLGTPHHSPVPEENDNDSESSD